MITSKTNKIVKTVKSLENKKYRDNLALFSIEGDKLIEELSKVKEPEFVIIREDKEFKYNYEKSYIVSNSVFKYLSNEKTPQGIMAIFKKNDEVNLHQIEIDNCLFLDNVQDASNVGGLIRSGICAGFDTCICYNSADFYSPKAVRASAGGIFHINLVKVSSYDCLDWFLNNDYDLIASDIRGREDINFNLHKNILIVGNEGKGINDKLLKKANKRVKIPMTGKIDSLNASVSGALLMYKISGYFDK